MKFYAPVLSVFLLLTSCGNATQPDNLAGTRVQSLDGGANEEQPQSGCNNVAPIVFAELIGQPNTVLLDVRTPAEVARGKISGALEMDFRAADFAERLADLDPTKTYLVYCASGGRSGKTCQRLSAAGFRQVYNLEGGYSAWTE